METLFEAITSLENLYLAYRKARKGKRHQIEIARFERNLEEELLALQAQLKELSYRPGKHRSFYRTEAKRRLISAAPFRDRVVHHALVRVIEPLFERRFIYDSYANRVGKGTHRALDRCTQFMRINTHLLPCDITQFFPSIDHAILRGQIAKVIHDEQALWLVDQILANGVGVLDEVYDMHWFPGDELLARLRPRGLPIGNLTSQFWANIYLNDLDHFIKRQLKCKDYLRYVDDFLLFSNHKTELHAWRQAVIDFLAGLRLTLHEPQAQPRPVSKGVTFLGFILFPTHRRLKPTCGYHFRRRLVALVKALGAGNLPLERINASVQGWTAHAAHGDTWGLRASILQKVVL